MTPLRLAIDYAGAVQRSQLKPGPRADGVRPVHGHLHLLQPRLDCLQRRRRGTVAGPTDSALRRLNTRGRTLRTQVV